MHHTFIEPLEARIAPASAVSIFTDRDGDIVTIKVTTPVGSSVDLKSALEAAQTFAFEGLGLQLQELNLTNPIFEGASVSITAKRGASGDGFVAIGKINATGRQLGSVVVDGDLGQLDAGGGLGTTALKKLTVQSMGRYGLSTQGNVGDLISFLNGEVGKITVKEDALASIHVLSGKLQSLTIGGSLLGGATVGNGTILTSGDVGSIKIGGNITAGTANETSRIVVGGDLKSLFVGGSVAAGSDGVADAFGQIDVIGNVGTLTIKGDIVGGDDNFDNDGQVEISGTVGTLTVGGSLLGSPDGFNSGAGGGAISVTGAVKTVKIAGDIVGSVTTRSGSLTLESSAKTILVGGDLVGGPGTNTGMIILGAGVVQSLTVNGDIIGGAQSATSGGINGTLSVDIQKLTIGGNLQSRGDSADQGFVQANSFGSILIKGNIIASTEVGSSTLQIQAFDGIGKLAVKGSINGTETNTVKILTKTLQSLSVGKNAEFAQIAVTGNHAQVKSVMINGAWVGSRLAVFTDDGPDQIYGTSDDTSPGGNTTASIAKIIIKGQALGTVGGTDSYVIRAPKIGSLSVAGTKYGFTTGAQSFGLGITGDLQVIDFV